MKALCFAFLLFGAAHLSLAETLVAAGPLHLTLAGDDFRWKEWGKEDRSWVDGKSEVIGELHAPGRMLKVAIYRFFGSCASVKEAMVLARRELRSIVPAPAEGQAVLANRSFQTISFVDPYRAGDTPSLIDRTYFIPLKDEVIAIDVLGTSEAIELFVRSVTQIRLNEPTRQLEPTAGRGSSKTLGEKR